MSSKTRAANPANPLEFQFSNELDFEVASLSLIQENAYCWIYSALVDGSTQIIKKYKGDDSTLIEIEAAAVDFYHDYAQNDDDFIDSKTLRLVPEANIACFEFVPGERLSDLVYRGAKNVKAADEAKLAMKNLGRFLRVVHENTKTSEKEVSPFLFEYTEYTARRLRSIPVLGRVLFRDIEKIAAKTVDDFVGASDPTSFVHGDFVFRNIHYQDGRVGLIDFANANYESHTLNDVYNLWFALNSMLLPKSYTLSLWEELQSEIRQLDFSDATHRFYFEYHRRRWLMLKIRTKSPKGWVQAIAGLSGFAKADARVL